MGSTAGFVIIKWINISLSCTVLRKQFLGIFSTVHSVLTKVKSYTPEAKRLECKTMKSRWCGLALEVNIHSVSKVGFIK